MYVFSYFPFGLEGRMWDLIVSVPDHCLSFYFTCVSSKDNAKSNDSDHIFVIRENTSLKHKCLCSFLM